MSWSRSKPAVHFETLPYESCASEIASFRNQQRGTAQGDDYFDWRYRRRPRCPGAHITWGRDDAGVAIAAAAAIPHELHFVDRTITSAVLGDIAVDRAWRGCGIAQELLSHLYRCAADRGIGGCLVLPNPQASGPLARAGWSPVSALSRYVRILSLRAPLARRFGAVGALAGGIGDRIVAAGRVLRPRPSPARGYAISKITRFGGDFDELWERLPRQGRILAPRDSAYLNWRFLAKPGLPPDIIEVRRHGELVGYVIYAQAEESLIVQDFLALDAPAAAAIGAEFVEMIRCEQRAEAIQARFVADSACAVPWRSQAFSRRADFQPVMWQGSQQGVLQVASRHWFVTPGDKDV